MSELCHYTSADLLRTVKPTISPRQLQWWCECGLLRPSLPGGRREFPADEVRVAGVISELRRRGAGIQSIARHLAVLRRAESGYLVVLWRTGKNGYRIAAIRHFPGTDETELVRLARKSRYAVLLIEVEQYAPRSGS